MHKKSPHELRGIDAHKYTLVREMFVYTADDNYVVARWCFVNSLDIDFLWMSVHALEKYLKAVLLLNGKSANKTGHKIGKLYGRVSEIASGLLPCSPLRKPEDNNILCWHEESRESFINRLYENGNESNRYQGLGYALLPDDLHKLDEMVFSIRRLCMPLDAYLFGQKLPGYPVTSNREHLLDHPGNWKLGGAGLESIIRGDRGEILRNVLLNCNIPFMQPGFEHTPLPCRSSSQYAALKRYIFDLLDDESSGPEWRQMAEELGNWVSQNMNLGGDTNKELEQALNRRRGGVSPPPQG